MVFFVGTTTLVSRLEWSRFEFCRVVIVIKAAPVFDCWDICTIVIVIGVMTGRRRVDMIDEMEEGRPRGAVGYQSDYGSRLSNLVREISKMDVTDQEFLRTLLTVGGGGQIPAGSSTEQLSHIPRPGDPRFLQTPRTLYDHDSASGWDTERQTSAPRHGRSGVQQTRERTYYSPETPAPPRGPTRPSVSGLGGSDFS